MAFAGLAYRAQWQRRGDFTFGVQQESYDKNVLSPDLPAARLTDHPLPPTETQRWHSANA